jgi:hypothetical protein
VTVTRASEVLSANRIDAEYYQPAKRATIERLKGLPGRPLGAYYAAIRQMFDPEKAQKQEIVRNFDLNDALQPVLNDEGPTMLASEVGSTKKRFAAGDVVISRLRAYLREIALVQTSPAVQAVGSSEFIVLRPIKADKPTLSRAALLVFLRSGPVQTILRWSQDGSHPAVLNGPSLLGFRWFLESGDRNSTLFFSKNGLVAPKIRRRRLENLVCSIIQVDATRGIPHCADPFRTAGSHHPRFGEEDLMCIPVPDAVCAAAPRIEKLFDEMLCARARARSLLAQAKRAVEIAIEDSEAAALKYLKEN